VENPRFDTHEGWDDHHSLQRPLLSLQQDPWLAHETGRRAPCRSPATAAMRLPLFLFVSVEALRPDRAREVACFFHVPSDFDPSSDAHQIVLCPARTSSIEFDPKGRTLS
jgi:hypothetical protein